MKRLLISLVFALLVGILPTSAQDSAKLITLNDATPAIDVVITLPPDTTGAISLTMAQAAITLTDSANAVVFQAADARLHAVELNIAPNSGSHTLTVERLPGVTEATVSVTSLPELNVSGTVERRAGLSVTLNEEVALPLDANTPGGTVSLSIPDDTIGVVTATFPGAYATTQLVDTDGVIVARSVGGHVDGVNLAIDAGAYEFTLVSSGLTETVVAGVRVVSAEDTGITILEAPAPATDIALGTTGTSCTSTITSSSVNFRSGPGTGYSVLGYGYLNESYLVGGHNPEDNWLVVATDTGSAWMARTGASLQGACDALTVFNIPLRDAEIAPLVITSSSYSDDDDDEYEDHDDDHDDDDHDDHEDEEHDEGDDD